MTTADDFAPVAITSRSGFDESVHFGAVVALAPGGEIGFGVGNPRSLIYPRSASKPVQALAMVRAGLDLPRELLALVCASHDGTPEHVAGVERILAAAGLDPSALANTAALPFDEAAAHDVLRHGGAPSALLMNCSGKHAGMLTTCVHNGWPLGPDYLEVDHPLQVAITATFAEVAGTPAAIGVDGCGAPAHVVELVQLAEAFRAIATGAAGRAGQEVYMAMTSHPQLVGGARRDVTLAMAGLPGLLAKDGAEGVFAAALPDGTAVAMKIADGGDRARAAVLLATLQHLGVDVAALAPLMEVRIMGHGRPVGAVRALV